MVPRLPSELPLPADLPVPRDVSVPPDLHSLPPRRSHAGARRRRVALGSPRRSWLLFMTAPGAPTPLYVVYQRDVGLQRHDADRSVFAVYVLALLTAVLVIGAALRPRRSPADAGRGDPARVGRARAVRAAGRRRGADGGAHPAGHRDRRGDDHAGGDARRPRARGRPGLARACERCRAARRPRRSARSPAARASSGGRSRGAASTSCCSRCMVASCARLLRAARELAAHTRACALARTADRAPAPRARPSCSRCCRSSWRAGRSAACSSRSGRRSPSASSGCASHFEGGVVVALLCATGAVTSFVLRAARPRGRSPPRPRAACGRHGDRSRRRRPRLDRARDRRHAGRGRRLRRVGARLLRHARAGRAPRRARRAVRARLPDLVHGVQRPGGRGRFAST